MASYYFRIISKRTINVSFSAWNTHYQMQTKRNAKPSLKAGASVFRRVLENIKNAWNAGERGIRLKTFDQWLIIINDRHTITVVQYTNYFSMIFWSFNCTI